MEILKIYLKIQEYNKDIHKILETFLIHNIEIIHNLILMKEI